MKEIIRLVSKLEWEGSSLKIPWVSINRNCAMIIAGNRQLEAVGQGDAGSNWIQVSSFGSLLEAKKYILEEISLDLNSMRSQNGVLCLTPEGFLRSLRHGLLPDDVRDYLKRGVTHLGFGPLIKTSGRMLSHNPNNLGVWRPYRKLYF